MLSSRKKRKQGKKMEYKSIEGTVLHGVVRGGVL